MVCLEFPAYSKFAVRMTAVTLIFPHQLFSDHPSVEQGRPAYLIEEYLFFQQYRFHRKKLMLHRASMKKYAEFLSNQNIIVNYIECRTDLSDVRNLIAELAEKNVTRIHVAELADNWLQKRIAVSCERHNIEVCESRSPNFLTDLDAVKNFFETNKTYRQTAFYIRQRKDAEILLDPDGRPRGGKWTYDRENREKYPRHEKPPAITPAEEDAYVQEARAYVAEYFSENYGNLDTFIYPTDHAGAATWLNEFLDNRFDKFGRYEDSIVAGEHFLHHSVLSPMLNIGLLSPHDVISRAIEVASGRQIPLNSLEGFIRQIMGWRELVRIVYERDGSSQRTRNFWGFKQKIPKSFWTGETGIFPVDNVIRKVLETGYSHHIERLMVMGNFMLLCEFQPDEVYRWFMEMYVDAYDWVMVPNVYGMSQFADGGMMVTKPYISASHYLMKMSDYPKGEWTEIWDGLFWRFLHIHRDLFLKNPRLGILVRTFDRFSESRKNKHIEVAENYLDQLNG
jgi:deoxyribodipyrimidine photolyase-related protein